MKAEEIVDKLLESDEYGPPTPDNFTGAMGSTKHLMDLKKQAISTMAKIVPALGLERQLRKHGVTRDQVSGYIRARAAYPDMYMYAGSDLERSKRKGFLPPDAIVGMTLKDGREIMFDLAVLPEKP